MDTAGTVAQGVAGFLMIAVYLGVIVVIGFTAVRFTGRLAGWLSRVAGRLAGWLWGGARGGVAAGLAAIPRRGRLHGPETEATSAECPQRRDLEVLGRAGRAAIRGLDWFTIGYFKILGMLLWLVFVWPVKFLWRQMNPGERVLPRFDWPKIYSDGEHYTVVANYGLPQKSTRAANFAFLGAACMTAYGFATVPYALLNQGQNLGLVFRPVMWTAIVVYVLLRFRRRTLRMRIGPDGIRWRIGWTGRGFVPPEDMTELAAEVLNVHSKAADEQDDENRRGKKTERIYRIASEVVMHSGFGLRNTQHIAEIHKDRNGLKAKLLQTGIRAAFESFIEEMERKSAQKAVDTMSLD